jgi:hypothetical protein
MMHKRLLMGVLTVLYMFLGMAFPAFAQYTLSLEAKDGAGNVKTQFAKGEDLYLNINLNNAAGVAGCAFTLNYEPNVLDPPLTDAEGLPVNEGDITSAFPFTQNSTPTYRENSAEAGKIYFAGAEIAADGGAKYGPGVITLFTVKFKVKNDALPGNFRFSLTQTELFNPAAGYGTDANSNGVYDAGDTKGKVPVLVGAVANSDPSFGGDLSDDFPILLGDQTQALAILQLAAKGAVADELVLNFGPPYGVWHYDPTRGWERWNAVSPSGIVAVDLNDDGHDELVAAFPGYGLYTKDSANDWQSINNVDPEKMIAADIDADGKDELVAGFAGYGLYYYDDPGGWSSQINGVVPDAMVRYSDGLVCDFGTTYGLWSYNTSLGWVPLNAEDPDKIVAADLNGDGKDELVVSFVGWGVYIYEPASGTWQQPPINTVMPEQIIAVDIDRDGNDELMVSFPGYGLYTYEPEDGTWDRINTEIPEAMIRLGNGIAVDFGAAYGLWTWTQEGGWQSKNDADPGQMVAVDIDNDGVEELVVAFAGYGLYYYDETDGWHFLNDVVPDDMKPINFYP